MWGVIIPPSVNLHPAETRTYNKAQDYMRPVKVGMTQPLPVISWPTQEKK